MKVACVSTIMKCRINRSFDIAIQSVKSQTYKDFDIFICYSKEPFWLDDGIDIPPKIDGVNFVEVENNGCMRFIEYSLTNLLDYDYVMIFGTDCTIPDYMLKMNIDYLESSEEKVCGVIGKKIVPYGWEYYNDIKTPTNVDVLSTVGICFKPKELINIGILYWKRECPLASMNDELWFNGCLARKGINRVMLPMNQFDIGTDKDNPISVTSYSKKLEWTIPIGISFYFRDYWEGFKNENSIRPKIEE